MAAIEAVQLVGGPCNGERPDASSLLEITVLRHAEGVAHVYEVTDEVLTREDEPATVFRYARSAGFRATL